MDNEGSKVQIRFIHPKTMFFQTVKTGQKLAMRKLILYITNSLDALFHA